MKAENKQGKGLSHYQEYEEFADDCLIQCNDLQEEDPNLSLEDDEMKKLKEDYQMVDEKGIDQKTEKVVDDQMVEDDGWLEEQGNGFVDEND